MKIQNIFFTTVFLSITTLIMVSCKKEQNSASPGISYQLQTKNRASVVGRVESGNIVWTSGYGNATEVKFESKGPNGKLEYKSNLQQRIDLFSGVSVLGNITLPPGTYQEVEFDLELNPTATEPAFLLNGSYTSTGPATPISFIISTPFEIKTEMNNVSVSANNGYNALTSLNLSLLSRGITQTMLDNAAKTNGTIIISSSSNVDLYNIILNNLKESDEIEFKHD